MQNDYLTATLSPPYKTGNSGHLYSYYPIPQIEFDNAGIRNVGNIRGFFYCQNEEKANELLEGQQKLTVGLGECFFYIYPTSVRLVPNNRMGTAKTYRNYIFLQLGNYQDYNTHEIMLGNVVNLMQIFLHFNVRIQEIEQRSSEFRKMPKDKSKCEFLVSEIYVSGDQLVNFNCI